MNSTILQGAKEFFFEAMISGWAGDAEEKIVIDELPGMKIIPFVRSPYRLVDAYYLSESSGRSLGSSTIWFNNEVIWGMQYGGRYDKRALPFLKSCLLEIYRKGEFHGGRGSAHMQEGEFAYVNQIARKGFREFEGDEQIFYRGHSLGSHWYHGTALI